MGFQLDGLFVIDDAVLPLFDRVIPGGARLALRTRQRGMPPGWMLPWPCWIEHLGDGTVKEVEGWAAKEHEEEWRSAAGMPADPVFEDAFAADDVRLASLLSLAAPAGVVMVDDQTVGGVLVREYAAVCVAGRLRASSGIDHGTPGRDDATAYRLTEGRYDSVDPATVDPVRRGAVGGLPAGHSRAGPRDDRGRRPAGLAGGDHHRSPARRRVDGVGPRRWAAGAMRRLPPESAGRRRGRSSRSGRRGRRPARRRSPGTASASPRRCR